MYVPRFLPVLAEIREQRADSDTIQAQLKQIESKSNQLCRELSAC